MVSNFKHLDGTSYNKALVAFARMYGVAETLEDLRNLSHEEAYELIVSWTNEYLSEDGIDFTDFFVKKLHTLLA